MGPEQLSHRCAAHGCQHDIPARLLMCNDHWRRVPTKLRKAVWDGWRRLHAQPCVSTQQAYHAAVRAAVEALHDKQLKRKAGADARTPPLF
jgi:hypothetical protein